MTETTYFVLQNRFDGLYWTGNGFDRQAWGQFDEAQQFETREEAEAEMKQYNIECRIVEEQD